MRVAPFPFVDVDALRRMRVRIPQAAFLDALWLPDPEAGRGVAYVHDGKQGRAFLAGDCGTIVALDDDQYERFVFRVAALNMARVTRDEQQRLSPLLDMARRGRPVNHYWELHHG